MKKITRTEITYCRGPYLGITVSSELMQDEEGLWARPDKAAYIVATGFSPRGPLGWQPIGDREDWTKWGFIAAKEAEGGKS
jgi:hypothetical protein